MNSDEHQAPSNKHHASSIKFNYGDYQTGKRYLAGLASAVGRLILLADAGEFETTNRFEGDSVIELVNYMTRHGLQFAKPEPGDESSYRQLFGSMRRIFEQLADRREVTPRTSGS